MSKKTLRIITIISTVLAVLTMCTLSFAANGSDPFSGLNPDQKDTDGITNIGKRIMGILQAIGIVAAVIILMVLGIKYMMGSAEEKAEYKKTMIPYVIGAILLFGATTIANAVYKFANGLNG